MKKLKYANYMNDEFYFATEEDMNVCLECWDNEIELTFDEAGRVYNEAGTYIADVIFNK